MHADHEADIVVNNLKNFYNNYKNIIYLSIITFIIISITTLAYQWYNNKFEQKAANNFFMLMSLDDQNEKIIQAKKFVNDYQSSPYASLAELLLVSEDLKNGNWQGVDMQVSRLKKNGAPDFILDQAYLLQARRFLATNQEDKALSTLQSIKFPNQMTVYIITGLAEKKAGNLQASKDSFRKASEILLRTNPESSLKNFIWYQQSTS